MKSMKAYISGPITANPNYEEEFREAAAMLSSLGYQAINPVDLVKDMLPPDLSAAELWKRAMEIDLDALKEADIVVLIDRKNLPSAGMDIEIDTARKKGIPIVPLDRIRRNLELRRQHIKQRRR